MSPIGKRIRIPTPRTLERRRNLLAMGNGQTRGIRIVGPAHRPGAVFPEGQALAEIRLDLTLASCDEASGTFPGLEDTKDLNRGLRLREHDL